ncbi:MAG: hypothetical protein AB7P04_01240 [Bacteriovoracia bacterium]
MNQAGFTLVETTVAGTVLALLLTVTLNGQSQIAQSAARLDHGRGKMDSAFKNWQLMFDPELCTRLLAGQPIRPDPGTAVTVTGSLESVIDLRAGAQFSEDQQLARAELRTDALAHEGDELSTYRARLNLIGSAEQRLESVPLFVEAGTEDRRIRRCGIYIEDTNPLQGEACASAAEVIVGFNSDGQIVCRPATAEALPLITCPADHYLVRIENGEPTCRPMPQAAAADPWIATFNFELSCRWRDGVPVVRGAGPRQSSITGGWQQGSYSNRPGNDPGWETPPIEFPPAARFLVGEIAMEAPNLQITQDPQTQNYSYPNDRPWRIGYNPTDLSLILEVRSANGTSGWGSIFDGKFYGLSSSPLGPHANYFQDMNSFYGLGKFGDYKMLGAEPTRVAHTPFTYYLSTQDQVLRINAQAPCYGDPTDTTQPPSRVSVRVQFCRGLSHDPQSKCYPQGRQIPTPPEGSYAD